MNPHNSKAGFVLYVALLTILTAGTVGGFFLYAAYNHSQAARRWHHAEQCLLDAQSGLEKVKHELVQRYLSNQVTASDALAWFQAWTTNAIGTNPAYILPALNMINDSAVIVTIANVAIATNEGYADITLLSAAARATPYAVTRLIQETLRVSAGGGGNDSWPFDHAYFINNYGWLGSAAICINGNVRANGNLKFSYAPRVNGDLYASGSIIGTVRNWSQSAYWNTANTSSQSRPTDPTAKNDINWPMGYDLEVTRNPDLPVMPMPVIGDINALASSANGKITRNGVSLVVNTYTGPGPDNITGTSDDNCVILDGSSSPITISGAVVVKGDLIIKGQVSGQGTIYAGRNIHIVGNLTYLNPPAWPKPDPDPNQTASINASKDMLVLAAKGNIVVGNYPAKTWISRVEWIMKDSANIFPYAVDPSDAALGYDTDNNPANGFLFDGRYYVNEANGGRRLSGAGTNTVPRKYYESSLADSTFSALCDANNVPDINAALYSNHGIIGNWGSSAPGGKSVLNGAMACHDDLNNFYGSFTVNWDIRLGSQSNDRINTYFMSASGGGTGVTTSATSTTIGWREIH